MIKKSILPLAIGTLIGFPLLGFVIHFFTFETSFLSLFISKTNLAIECIVGIVSGLLFGWVGWKIISMKFMSSVLTKYQQLISTFEIDTSLIFFVSFCAGFGEEVFFRGVLQPIIGIWITAVLFVAIHGYLNPKNWKISVYGIYLTLVIALIGYFNNYLGLTSAIISHMMIDVVLFYKLYQNKSSKISS